MNNFIGYFALDIAFFFGSKLMGELNKTFKFNYFISIRHEPTKIMVQN